MHFRPFPDSVPGDRSQSRVTVAILATGADAQMAAAAELEGVGRLRYCETADALTRLVADGDVSAIVTEPRDAAGVPASSFVALLHDRIPEIPIIVWFWPTPAGFREVPSTLAVGAADCAVRGHDWLPAVLHAAWEPAWRPGAITPLLHILRLLIPPDLEEFGIICAVKASPRLTPARVAEWMRIKERTLRDRLQQASLAPPSVFLDYATAIHAAFLLDEAGLEPEVVVDRMRFGRTRSLSALLRQFSGRHARGVREHGGFNAMLARAEASLRRDDQTHDSEENRLIDRFLADELSPVQRVEFERWLAVAPPGVAEVLEGVRLLQGERPQTPEDVRARQRVWARLRRELGRGFGS
ncbi:MAG: hypothetical protein ACREL3_01830 [Gemmatimonadales bacterium]